MDELAINTGDVALIFEGGGMRNAYTASVVTTLLEAGINFPKVYGVSAGAVLAVDYVARDAVHAKRVFTQAASYPEAGGVRSFLRGHGFFNTAYVFGYTENARGEFAEGDAHGRSDHVVDRGNDSTGAHDQSDHAVDWGNAPTGAHDQPIHTVDQANASPDAHDGTSGGGITCREFASRDSDLWRFDDQTFFANPTDVCIEALDMQTGETATWSKEAMPTPFDVIERVTASCAYPLFTTPALIDGHRYIDGGMGTSHGICLDSAHADGFTRFFIVRTQERSYRKPPLNVAKRVFYKLGYARYPKMYEALVARPAAYNALLDEIDKLEREGMAYVFCPDDMPITYMTPDCGKLLKAYEQGLRQCHDELPRWRAWLNDGYNGQRIAGDDLQSL